MRYITTSWDDGYPADHRLAELLQKYNLQGTFYIPRANDEYEVMPESEILQLARHFEVGGHTLNHVSIDNTSESLFKEEILGCYQWLEELLGEKPVSFCFPRGIYNQPAVDFAFETGFKVIRTTELLNPGYGYPNGVIPTTVQVYPHAKLTYFKHLLKRFKFKSLAIYVRSGIHSNLMHIVDYYLEHVRDQGGVFHLWGHSWEIEKYELWKDLERIFKLIAHEKSFQYIPNQELEHVTPSELSVVKSLVPSWGGGQRASKKWSNKLLTGGLLPAHEVIECGIEGFLVLGGGVIL